MCELLRIALRSCALGLTSVELLTVANLRLRAVYSSTSARMPELESTRVVLRITLGILFRQYFEA